MPGYHLHLVAITAKHIPGTKLYVSTSSHVRYEVYNLWQPMWLMSFPIDNAERVEDYEGDKASIIAFAEDARAKGSICNETWIFGSHEVETLDLYTRLLGDSVTYHFKLYFDRPASRKPEEIYRASQCIFDRMYTGPANVDTIPDVPMASASDASMTADDTIDDESAAP